MNLELYLFFEGRCDEAIEFYRKALGAEATALMRYRDNPEGGSVPQGREDKVMHANIRIGETTVMLSDGDCSGQTDFRGFSLCLNPTTETEATRMFDGLSEGGTVLMPLGKTFFSPLFGMVRDRFGLFWMVVVMSPEEP